MWDRVLAATLSIQLPANAPGSGAEDRPSVWALPPTGEAWVKLLTPGSALVVAGSLFPPPLPLQL